MVNGCKMAGACFPCKALRSKFYSMTFLKPMFISTELKHVIPAGLQLTSRTGFVRCRRFYQNRNSARCLSLRDRQQLNLNDMSRINTQWSRNINGTLFLLHRDPGEAKLRGIQFKAKIEQMKEMVRT